MKKVISIALIAMLVVAMAGCSQSQPTATTAAPAETQAQIDRKVVELVKSEHQKALNILTENRAKLDELAKYLYEKEAITGEEFMNILNG